MPIENKESWEKMVEENKENDRNRTTNNVAIEVMRLLDEEKEFDIHEIICRADKNIKAGGITRHMAYTVTQILFRYHSRREEIKKQGDALGKRYKDSGVTFRVKWWNKGWEKGEKSKWALRIK